MCYNVRMDIITEREIKRMIHQVASDEFVEALPMMTENFYKKLFKLYGLEFTPEVVKQKRLFLCKATEFFIFKILPREVAVATIINTKFENGYIYSPATKAFKKSLEQYINNLEELILSCDTSEDFEKKFSEKYNINLEDLTNYLKFNREDEISPLNNKLENFLNSIKKKKIN